MSENVQLLPKTAKDTSQIRNISHQTNINFKIKYKELFPNTLSLIIFIFYITLFVNHGLLTHATQNSKTGSYDYDPTVIVLLTEILKILICSIIILKDKTLKEAVSQLLQNSALLALYLIPSGLYVFYNNVSFLNLQNYNPATYLLFLNLRTVILGFVYQQFFNKKLSSIQWASLVTLTIGCILKNVDFGQILSNSKFSIHNFGLMLAQIMSSCIANVYNEFLLKKHSQKMDVWFQNFCMYFNGVVLNLILLSYHRSGDIQIFKMVSDFDSSHYLLIFNQAFLGVSASLLLKHLNSIVKAFSTAIEMVVSAAMSYGGLLT